MLKRRPKRLFFFFFFLAPLPVCLFLHLCPLISQQCNTFTDSGAFRALPEGAAHTLVTCSPFYHSASLFTLLWWRTETHTHIDTVLKNQIMLMSKASQSSDRSSGHCCVEVGFVRLSPALNGLCLVSIY